MHKPIEERYEWLVQRLRTEFPDNEIVGKALDMGSQFGVAINTNAKNRRQSAVRVEYYYTVGGHEVTENMPDGSTFSYTDGGKNIKYSLNELSAADCELAVQKIIAAFKKVAE